MDTALLAILACPKCREPLELLTEKEANEEKDAGLACACCAAVYPIRDDIPVLLIDEALPRKDWDAGLRERNA